MKFRLVEERVERTVYNALSAYPRYKEKYGWLSGLEELKYNFNLLDNELIWIINKLYDKDIFDDYDKDNAISYFKLDK